MFRHAFFSPHGVCLRTSKAISITPSAGVGEGGHAGRVVEDLTAKVKSGPNGTLEPPGPQISSISCSNGKSIDVSDLHYPEPCIFPRSVRSQSYCTPSSSSHTPVRPVVMVLTASPVSACVGTHTTYLKPPGYRGTQQPVCGTRYAAVCTDGSLSSCRRVV